MQSLAPTFLDLPTPDELLARHRRALSRGVASCLDLGATLRPRYRRLRVGSIGDSWAAVGEGLRRAMVRVDAERKR